VGNEGAVDKVMLKKPPASSTSTFMNQTLMDRSIVDLMICFKMPRWCPRSAGTDRPLVARVGEPGLGVFKKRMYLARSTCSIISCMHEAV
jgi:hypothetical protein